MELSLVSKKAKRVLILPAPKEKPPGPVGHVVDMGDVQAQAPSRGSALPSAVWGQAPGITGIWLGGSAGPFGTVSATPSAHTNQGRQSSKARNAESNTLGTSPSKQPGEMAPGLSC